MLWFSETELSTLQQKYGTIPEVLREYYTRLGAHKALNGMQDFLIPPMVLHKYEQPGFLVFYSENQGACVWGIKQSDLSISDPPVYENYGTGEWFQTTETLSLFLLSMAHLQAAFSMEYSNEEFIPVTVRQADEIRNVFLSKQADSALYTGVRFYGNYDDVIIVVMKNDDNYLLWYGADSPDHYEETNAAITRIIGL